MIMKPPVGARLNVNHPLAQGLVGAWLFNEGGGLRAYDASLRRNHGTLANGATWVETQYGQAVNLDGTNDEISIGTGNGLSGNDLSFVALIRIDTFSGGGLARLIEKNEAGDNGYSIDTSSAAGNTLRFYSQNGSGGAVVAPGGSLATGTWYVVAGSYAENTKAGVLYINGKQVAAGTLSGGLGNHSAVPLTLGGRAGDTLRQWDGQLVYVYLYDRALPPAVFRSLYVDPYQFMRLPHSIVLKVPVTAKTLTAEAGSYVITGTNENLRLAKKLTAAAGSYLITGIAVNLKIGKKIAAAASSYSLTGASANLRHGWKVAAAAGSYAISGQAATLKHGWKLISVAGSYVVTGNDAALTKTGIKILVADSSSYSMNGQSTSLLHAWKATVGVGSYSINGSAANLRLARKMAAAAGSYSVNGINANLVKGKRVAMAAGAYAVTGFDVTLLLKHNVTLSTDAGIYLISGQPVTLTYVSLNPPRTRTAGIVLGGHGSRSSDDFDIRPSSDFGRRS